VVTVDSMAQRPTRVEDAVCLPGVPQQETAHDCGFFILEMILRALQLTPKALRELATASSVEIAMLPWPSQKQIFRRKARLREALDKLLEAGRKLGTGDVEAMLEGDSVLKAQIRAALQDGAPSFQNGYDRWAVGDWDLSPSPSKSRSASVRGRSRDGSVKKGKRKRKKKRGSDSSTRSRERGRRRKKDRSSTRSRSASENNKPPANANVSSLQRQCQSRRPLHSRT
jgi:hypothetical protein